MDKILELLEFLNYYYGKIEFYNPENIYKLFPLTSSNAIKLEIKYKMGKGATYIIILNDLNYFQRIKKINKIVSNI